MHEFTSEVEELAKAVMEYSLARLKSDPPLDGPRSEADLYAELGNTITAAGLGGKETLKVFTETLALACISTDHPRNLAFIPSAPSEYSNLFDLVVGASSLYGGSWQEGAGAVFAENQAIKWLIDIAGLPSSAGGVFVQGGTMGNLSALVVARDQARKTHPDTERWVIACSAESHSSITSAAHVMDVDLLKIETNEELRLDGAHVATAIDELHATTNKRVFAIVGTAGSTNLGIVDDLASLAITAKERNIWFHVDGAYGLAGLCAPSVRHLYEGVENADSFIVDPHKWLFAPFDACALVYRNPALAKETHTQHASYLETLHDDSWSPSDYAIHLTRRVRGLPFWFSLAAHGTDAYSKAVEEGIRLAKDSAKLIAAHPNLELVREPELSIVAFTRKRWSPAQYQEWSDALLEMQIGFIPPSKHAGESILRFAFVNPWTSMDDVQMILDTL
ncbi:PLP-dependent protein [Candidatus Planktophila dulcis]|uniref:pyridoxal phosphate-dependent decarboxylase family protein n=1 Tax=Candidatus Planktophila dulcis TaxID=1884914 RepID=UPI000BAC4D4F|nr:aminotransferase class V-fold PLP-dependent enzyme [Candidatus Planktophila dulcis]ASY14381.1 PLP-dependent protein [Candidatus Planktophila dulcis]